MRAHGAATLKMHFTEKIPHVRSKKQVSPSTHTTTWRGGGDSPALGVFVQFLCLASSAASPPLTYYVMCSVVRMPMPNYVCVCVCARACDQGGRGGGANGLPCHPPPPHKAIFFPPSPTAPAVATDRNVFECNRLAAWPTLLLHTRATDYSGLQTCSLGWVAWVAYRLGQQRERHQRLQPNTLGSC